MAAAASKPDLFDGILMAEERCGGRGSAAALAFTAPSQLPCVGRGGRAWRAAGMGAHAGRREPLPPGLPLGDLVFPAPSGLARPQALRS